MVDLKRELKDTFDTIVGNNQGGRYVDQHKIGNNVRVGQEQRTSRMFDIYNQSRQESVKDHNDGLFDRVSVLEAIGCFFLGFIFQCFIFPSVQNSFPFSLLWPLVTKPGMQRFIHSIIVGALFAGGWLIYCIIVNDRDSAIQHNTKKMLDDPDNNFQSFIDIPEELPQKYDIVPDEKVHFSKDVTSLLSHMMISNRGIKGKDGKVHFDNKFSQQIFDLAKLPNDPTIRKIYDANALTYGKDGAKTVQDFINKYWHVPDCEDPDSQDPAGVYVVSTANENTVVAAETRAGKGQHYIEEMLDIWSRQDHKPNIVVTDLKMELLVMFLKTFTLRGYNVKALNLLVDSKTDAINFIGYAVNEAIRGNSTKMQTIVRNLAAIYFPNKGSDNPMWTQAAGAVFTRTVLGLIDYYYEYVADIKNDPNNSLAQIDQKSDEAWGHVTLYNAYRFVVDTASKMFPKDTYESIYPKDKNGNVLDPDPDATAKSGLTIYFDATNQLPQNSIREKIAEQNGAIKITGKSERTMASIYAVTLFGMIFFTDSKVINLTSARPSQNLDMKGFAYPRRIAVHFNNEFLTKHPYKNAIAYWESFHDPAMKHPYKGKGFTYRGSVDKYGWAEALFEGVFDNEIKSVDDGNKQNPRRRRGSKQPLTYLRLSIIDPDSINDPNTPNLVLDTYSFIFKKNFRKSTNGRNYAMDKITNKREVQGGSMRQYTYVASTNTARPYVGRFYKNVHSLDMSLSLQEAKSKTIRKAYRIIDDYDIHYSDNPTALFLVAPPSMPVYNKLLLNTIDLLYNEQVESAFLGTDDQKPFNVTKYMLDEFGNMQSEGTGVPALGPKLTSGLAQGQQFTMILQSMEQLKSIYGEEVAQILQANVETFFFLKSKDSSLINLLIAMNGKKVVINQSSQGYETPLYRGGFHFSTKDPNYEQYHHPKVNVNYNKDVRPLLDENAYLHLNSSVLDGNAIVSRGSSTVVSKGPTILPMSFFLFGNGKRTGGYGEGIVPQALPVIADTTSFNPLNNIPNFDDMIAQRIKEAEWTPKVTKRYMEVNGLTKRQMDLIPRDELSRELMEGIHLNMKNEDKTLAEKKLNEALKSFNAEANEKLNNQYERKSEAEQTKLDQTSTEDVKRDVQDLNSHYKEYNEQMHKRVEERRRRMQAGPNFSVRDFASQMAKKSTQNTKFISTAAQLQKDDAERREKRYAHNELSRADIMTTSHEFNGTYIDVIRKALDDLGSLAIFPNCEVKEDGVYHNGMVMIKINSQYSDYNRFSLTAEFARYLTSFKNWEEMYQFDDMVSRELDQKKRDEADHNQN